MDRRCADSLAAAARIAATSNVPISTHAARAYWRGWISRVSTGFKRPLRPYVEAISTKGEPNGYKAHINGRTTQEAGGSRDQRPVVPGRRGHEPRALQDPPERAARIRGSRPE